MSEMVGFGELTRPQREQVRRMFPMGDYWDYVYEVGMTGHVHSRRHEPMQQYQAMSPEWTVITTVRARTAKDAEALIEAKMQDWAARLSFGHEYLAKWEAAGRAMIAV